MFAIIFLGATDTESPTVREENGQHEEHNGIDYVASHFANLPWPWLQRLIFMHDLSSRTARTNIITHENSGFAQLGSINVNGGAKKGFAIS